jgi:hypothetical protein
MNDGITLSTFEIFQMFPDAETARVYLESRRWKNGVTCPHCCAEKIFRFSPLFKRVHVLTNILRGER